jgi:hypothetical protein
MSNRATLPNRHTDHAPNSDDDYSQNAGTQRLCADHRSISLLRKRFKIGVALVGRSTHRCSSADTVTVPARSPLLVSIKSSGAPRLSAALPR